ncbi:MAG: MgtC/SapB family protein [Eubacteriales bacterium]|nr:MgtC/SapB family protein [Eubacteriales bacterium]
MAVREVTYTSIMIRILAAFFLGGIIGMERGMKNRPAGLRTYMLVCVGSCLIMLTNQYIYQVFDTGDPVRMGAQVVSGIGFLGAGTIVVTKRNQIRGLTTAAGLWAAAAVGLAIGIGFYEAAVLGGCAIYAVLTVMHRWDDQMHRNSKIMEIYVELSTSVTLGSFIRGTRELGLEIDNLQLDHTEAAEDDIRSFIVTLKSRAKQNHQQLLDSIRAVDGVVYLEEL